MSTTFISLLAPLLPSPHAPIQKHKNTEIILKVFLLIFTWRNICIVRAHTDPQPPILPFLCYTICNIISMYQTKWKQNNNKKKQQTQSKTDAQQSIAFNSKKKTQFFLCAAQTNSSSILFHFAERLNTVPCVLSSYSILFICSAPHLQSPTPGASPLYSEQSSMEGKPVRRRSGGERAGHYRRYMLRHKTSFSMELL